MDYVARQFARDIACMLRNYKQTSLNPFKINFSCHICGDSAKDAHAARGWFYEHKGAMRYGCFNCGRNFGFSSYLKEYHPEKYREYLLEKHGDREKKEVEPEVDLSKFSKKLPTVKPNIIGNYGFRLDTLPDGHPAKVYMVNRKIPVDKLHLFWFTIKWRELANKIHEGTYKYIQPEPRIVIPIYDESGDISAIQGRALRKDDLRYVTVKVDEDSNKVYGTERIDKSKRVFFLEGPIDSVFVNNAVAIVGGNMSVNDAPYKGNRAWLLDNEPRSIDTCKRIKRYIDAGESVVLWDKFKYTSKDVNDMILKEGATIEEINDYVQKNVVSGLVAKMRFAKWCKVKI